MCGFGFLRLPSIPALENNRLKLVFSRNAYKMTKKMCRNITMYFIVFTIVSMIYSFFFPDVFPIIGYLISVIFPVLPAPDHRYARLTLLVKI
jgi:hypothetical protein